MRFEIDYPNDDKVVLVDTRTLDEVLSANYDEHGYAGMGLLEQFAKVLNSYT